MVSTRFTRLLAAPVLSAGIIGCAALGLAGMAHADASTDPAVSGSTSGIVAAPGHVRRARRDVDAWVQSLSEQEVNVPSVDTTVYQSR